MSCLSGIGVSFSRVVIVFCQFI